MYINPRYKEIVTFLENGNPDLFGVEDHNINNVEEIRKKISSEQNPVKKNLLIQCHNIFAFYLGQKLIEEIKIKTKTEKEQKIKFPKRSVALKVNESYYDFMNSIFTFLPIQKPSLKIFQDYKSMSKQILSGSICGIIDYKNPGYTSTEEILRYYLRVLYELSYEESRTCPLPPFFETTQAPSLTEIFSKGDEFDIEQIIGLPIESKSSFVLEDNPCDLINKMLPPKEEITTLVIADEEKEAKSMIDLLKTPWPNMKTITLIGKEKTIIKTIEGVVNFDNPKIILLDEDLPGYCLRADFVKKLREKASRIICSISSGEVPDFSTTDRHFGLKARIGWERSSALAFIKFMNNIINVL